MNTDKKYAHRGAFGVHLDNDNSPVYIVQRVKGDILLCSIRFDDPASEWIPISRSRFWLLADG